MPAGSSATYAIVCAIDTARGQWHFDRLELITGIVFADGVESGDTSAWSATLP